MLLACGINYQTAPLSVREKVVFIPEQVKESLRNLISRTQANEAAILSTCNRTEIYSVGQTSEIIVDWLHQHQQLPAGQLNSHIYIHQGQSAVKHLLRVASGLDSMVLGEPQILGQVKDAFSCAKTAGTLGRKLQRLFEYVFSVTKQVRTETEIGTHPVSVAFAAVDLTKRIFADFSSLSALLVGAGDTVALAARHLQAQGVKQFWVANRTLTNAEKLAAELSGQAIPITAINDYLINTDILITATASTTPLIGKGAIESALKVRKHKPMFIADLAVPRDVEPEVAELDDVYLYSMDDLQTIIQQNQRHRASAAEKAEIIVEQQASNFMCSLKILDATSIIQTYRKKAENLCDAEIAKALQALQSGINAEEVIQRLAQGLTNKLLHEPTVQLRDIIARG